jgi:type IV secretory pathway VirB10-like protein
MESAHQSSDQLTTVYVDVDLEEALPSDDDDVCEVFIDYSGLRTARDARRDRRPRSASAGDAPLEIAGLRRHRVAPWALVAIALGALAFFATPDRAPRTPTADTSSDARADEAVVADEAPASPIREPMPAPPDETAQAPESPRQPPPAATDRAPSAAPARTDRGF